MIPKWCLVLYPKKRKPCVAWHPPVHLSPSFWIVLSRRIIPGSLLTSSSFFARKHNEGQISTLSTSTHPKQTETFVYYFFLLRTSYRLFNPHTAKWKWVSLCSKRLWISRWQLQGISTSMDTVSMALMLWYISHSWSMTENNCALLPYHTSSVGFGLRRSSTHIPPCVFALQT